METGESSERFMTFHRREPEFATYVIGWVFILLPLPLYLPEFFKELAKKEYSSIIIALFVIAGGAAIGAMRIRENKKIVDPIKINKQKIVIRHPEKDNTVYLNQIQFIEINKRADKKERHRIEITSVMNSKFVIENEYKIDLENLIEIITYLK